jgi:hypothetical protein
LAAAEQSGEAAPRAEEQRLDARAPEPRQPEHAEDDATHDGKNRPLIEPGGRRVVMRAKRSCWVWLGWASAGIASTGVSASTTVRTASRRAIHACIRRTPSIHQYAQT